ncbi:MAG: alpha-amylase family glycosyl hydrolase [Bacteroidales bacterium]|nr:alpha-amylase family glycosyl hydrolase [Bacteroidales bacterium]MDD4236421.1 alpha-amylase family glycosyl hydrolase [Bacteroidales bacterium]
MRCLFWLIILCLVIANSCNINKNNEEIYTYDAVSELFLPIWIEPGKNTIYLSDYFYNTDLIDSVSYQYPEYLISINDTALILDIDYNHLNYISELLFWIGDKPYSLLLKKRKLLETSISFDPNMYKSYDEVKIAGEWNNWNPDKCIMKFEEYVWEKKFYLEPGEYQYQIVADGEWMTNPTCKDSVPNGFGNYNSINKVIWEKGEPPQIYTERFTDKELIIRSTEPVDEFFILWQNKRMQNEPVLLSDNEYKLLIPEEAFITEFSNIRVFGLSEQGITNDLFIPLKKGKVINSTNDFSRHHKHNQIMYFVLIDRFFNGNTANDKALKDSTVDFRANYQGGDIDGVYKKLKDGYFDKLGINTLWLSPLMQNPEAAYKEFPEPRRKYSGYHGYWPISSTDIDYRFGTKESLKDLIDLAHNKNKNVILDFVANHVHELHPLYQKHPEWATDLILEDGTKNIRIWEEQRLTTWFDTFLPSWNFSIPEVREQISEYAMYWLNEYNIDGFRHDATKHIPESFWRLLTHKIKASRKSVYQIGETFGDRKLIGSYVTTGMLDAQFDFNLYFDARYTFANDSVTIDKLCNSLNASLNAYGHHHLMGNITGNHDLPRFISLASGDLAFDEDDKEAGWNREIQVSDDVAYKKMELLMAFIFTIPGIPCIYYGDEIGMPGAGDPDNRRMMIFNNLDENQTSLFNTCSKLAQLRESSMALLYGETTINDNKKMYLTYYRKYFDEIVIIIINKASCNQVINASFDYLPSEIDLKALNGTDFKYLDNNLIIELSPMSYEILTTNKI